MKNSFLVIFLFLTFGLQAQMFQQISNNFPQLAWGSIAYADFDLDGDLDLLISGRNKQNLAITKLYRNDNGKFTEISAGIENIMLSSMVWADFNNDKYPDILINGKNNKGEAVSKIYQNYGNGTFKKVSAQLTAVASGAVAVADYDHDGDLDILLSGQSKTVPITKIYENKGGFRFIENNSKLQGVMNSAVAWADFNGDNYPDIILSGKADNYRYTKIYINQKNKTFKEIPNNLPQLGNSAIACADFNNDKKTDIIISGLDIDGNEQTKLFINDGSLRQISLSKTRGFINADHLLSNLAYGSINVADINGNKKPDIILTGKGKTKVTEIYLNKGNANFKKVPTSIPGVFHSASALADFNGDKKPDIIIMGLDKDNKLLTAYFKNKGIDITKISNVPLIRPAFEFSQAIEGSPCKFNNRTSNDLNRDVVYSWNFGDGTVSNEKNPTHSYAKAGRYTVVLTAKSGDIIETATKVVFVRPKHIESIVFPEREMLILNTEAIKLLKKYESLMNELGSISNIEDEKTGDIKEQIINLFLNRQIVVFNDLDPTYSKSKLKEIETYTSDILLLYPDGIKISIDTKTARMGRINQHGDNLYSVDIIATKRINGNYMNKMQNTETRKLAFRIAFKKNNKTFSDFKFVGIRDFYEPASVQDERTLEEINKISLTPQQEEQIDNASKSLLNDYIRNLSLIGNPEEDPDDKDLYQVAFVELFTDSSAVVYNDIDPDTKENDFPPDKYIKQYRNLYPQGIKNINLNIDSAKFKPAIKNDDGTYYRYVYADKNFSGIYKGKNKNTVSENLAFKISFDKEGSSFQNFKFINIEQSSLNFYQGNTMAEMDTNTFIIKQIEREGISLGITLTGGLGSIYDKTALDEKLGGEDIWSLTPEFSYSIGFEFDYFFTNNLAVKTGISYSAFSSTYTIDGTYADDNNTLTTDVNNDSFIKNLNADNYTNNITLSNIDIPVQLLWVSSENRKIGAYASAGLMFSFTLNAESTSNGTIQYYGYYPDNPEVIQELYIEELGFFNKTYTESEQTYATTSYNITLTASAGVSIPIGYFSTLRLGPEIIWGLSDISNKTNYTNLFGEETDNLGTTLRNYGFNISYTYKF